MCSLGSRSGICEVFEISTIKVESKADVNGRCWQDGRQAGQDIRCSAHPIGEAVVVGANQSRNRQDLRESGQQLECGVGITEAQ